MDSTMRQQPSLVVYPNKATPEMQQSLQLLRESLLCPLCHEMMQSPMTSSSCGHSFCKSCIDEYNCNHYNCPVDGCNLPLSMSGRGKSFRQLNPALLTVVTSYEAIVKALNEAPDTWWDVNPEEYYQSSTTLNPARDETEANAAGVETIDLDAVNTSQLSVDSSQSGDTEMSYRK